jgi:hypothetical protein
VVRQEELELRIAKYYLAVVSSSCKTTDLLQDCMLTRAPDTRTGVPRACDFALSVTSRFIASKHSVSVHDWTESGTGTEERPMPSC